MSHIHLFPPQFVYSTILEDHTNLKNTLFPKLLETAKDQGTNSVNWNCECFTSWGKTDLNQHLQDPSVQDQIIWTPLNELLSGYLGQFLKFELNPHLLNIWFNFYEKGYYQEIHDHLYEEYNNILSGIYVLHLEEEGQNTTLFHSLNHTHYLISTLPTEETKEGTLFLFPGSLHHEVKPSLGKRATISFNLSLDGTSHRG